MSDIGQRLEYLEAANEALKMQNRVLAAAFRGLLRGLPPETAQSVIESVQNAFEHELDALAYEAGADAELFHEATYAFFREKE